MVWCFYECMKWQEVNGTSWHYAGKTYKVESVVIGETSYQNVFPITTHIEVVYSANKTLDSIKYFINQCMFYWYIYIIYIIWNCVYLEKNIKISKSKCPLFFFFFKRAPQIRRIREFGSIFTLTFSFFMWHLFIFLIHFFFIQDAVKIMAKDLVRTRRYIKKFILMKANIQAVSLKIQTLRSNNAMAQAMKGVTRAMQTMNKQVSPTNSSVSACRNSFDQLINIITNFVF